MHLPSGYVTCCDSPFSHVYERRAAVYISRCHVIITRSNVARTCCGSQNGWSLACGFRIPAFSSPFWLPGSISLLSSRSQRWQQVIFCKSKSSHKSFPCKSKSSHKSFPCKSKSSHKSFPCKSKSSHKSFGQTSSQVKSQVIWSKHKSSRTLFLPLPS